MSGAQSPSRWKLKMRRSLEGLEPIIIVGCLLLVVAGGWLGYGGIVETGTATEQAEYGSIDYDGTFDYGAVVTEDTAVYEAGDRLTDKQVYYTDVSPTVEGEYTVTFRGSNTATTEAEVILYRVIQSTTNGEIIWQQRQQIGRQTVSGDSGTVPIPFTEDIPSIEQEIQTIQNQLGASPGTTEVYLLAEMTILGTANGVSETTSETARLDINPSGDTFTLSQDQASGTQTIGTIQTVEQPPSYLHGGIGILLAVIGLIGAAIGYRAYNRDLMTLSKQERDWLRYRDDHNEFEEWITTINLPEDARELPAATAGSLGDLVDFAIDTNNSVIKDPDDGNYYVVHEGTRYEYVPPSPPTTQIGWRDFVMDVEERPATDQDPS